MATLAAIRHMWKVAVLTSAVETLVYLAFVLYLSGPNAGVAAGSVVAFIFLSPFILFLGLPLWLVLALAMYAGLALMEAWAEDEVWLSTIVSALAGFVVGVPLSLPLFDIQTWKGFTVSVMFAAFHSCAAWAYLYWKGLAANPTIERDARKSSARPSL